MWTGSVAEAKELEEDSGCDGRKGWRDVVKRDGGVTGFG